jgi:hypothetical protein
MLSGAIYEQVREKYMYLQNVEYDFFRIGYDQHGGWSVSLDWAKAKKLGLGLSTPKAKNRNPKHYSSRKK